MSAIGRRAGAAAQLHHPERLLAWFGQDEASARLASRQNLRRKQPTFASVVRPWMAHV